MRELGTKPNTNQFKIHNYAVYYIDYKHVKQNYKSKGALNRLHEAIMDIMLQNLGQHGRFCIWCVLVSQTEKPLKINTMVQF